MSKIAIISQPDRGVLVDVGGCTTLQEAAHHLTSTLQISSEFWKGINIDLNLGTLELSGDEVAQILSIASEVGVKPSHVFTDSDKTRGALRAHNVTIGEGAPMKMDDVPAERTEAAAVEAAPESGPEAQPEPSASPDAASAAPNETSTACGAPTGQPQPAQPPAPPQPPAVLYLKQTLRSGQAVSHKGHLVIVGDVNPGAEVRAEGDITVWGALRGIAHAGTGGNVHAEIRALRLQPIQIRIAHAIARSPDRASTRPSSRKGPETARIVNGIIRISVDVPE